MTDRELHKFLGVIADQCRARIVEISYRGSGHKQITYEQDGAQFKQIVPSTPSDRWRGRQNMEADARRLLRR
jgi:hypothetical protein